MSKNKKKSLKENQKKGQAPSQKGGTTPKTSSPRVSPTQVQTLSTSSPSVSPATVVLQSSTSSPSVSQNVPQAEAQKSKDALGRSLLLEVRDLKVFFPIFGGVFYRKVGDIKAVDGVSFNLYEGETLGMVGESGCGKSTTGKALINLLKSTIAQVQVSGTLLFHSKNGKVVDLNKLSRQEMLPYRSEIQMIFQDPQSSLNPRFTVGQIIEEPLTIHRPELSAGERQEICENLLNKVGLGGEHRGRYPHEFSGGQRQRIGIARALASRPRLIIADEPVSALDVSIQAQVINLLQDLQEEFRFSYIFIAHDLSVVQHISDRIAVMYLGNIVEMGKASTIYQNPVHPYSKALLSAVPLPDPRRKKERILLKGDPPSPSNKPSGCSFRLRCPLAQSDCAKVTPPLVEKEAGHFVACPYV
jgi:oligopeptide transport system ATP-binding protein